MPPTDDLFRIMSSLSPTQLAYSLPHFAESVDLSLTTVRSAIAHGELVPVYPARKKPLITREEALRWLASLPQEPPSQP